MKNAFQLDKTYRPGGGLFRVVLATAAGLLVLTPGCATQSGSTSTAPARSNGSAPLRLACRFAIYGSYQDTAWTHLPSIGVKYVFMSVPPAGEVEQAEKHLSEHNLTALVVRGEADFTQDSAVDALDGQLAVCEKMGVKFMFLSVKGRWPDKRVVYQRLRRSGELAKRHGVTITLETHPELGTNGDVQLETMRGVDHPNVRVNFDTGNITYYNKGGDAAAELKKIIDYVATVEIKDHSGEFETWNFPPLGQGSVNIPEILRILKANHYSGPITIEVEGVKGVTWSEDQTKAAVAESVRYLRSLSAFR